MAGLGSGVEQEGRTKRVEKCEHFGPVADIEFVMAKIWVEGLQAPLIPTRIALWTEEIGSHIVVDAVDFPSETAKVIHYFGSDET